MGWGPGPKSVGRWPLCLLASILKNHENLMDKCISGLPGGAAELCNWDMGGSLGGLRVSGRCGEGAADCAERLNEVHLPALNNHPKVPLKKHNVHICAYTRICTYVHVCIYIHTVIYTYVYMYICLLLGGSSPPTPPPPSVRPGGEGGLAFHRPRDPRVAKLLQQTVKNWWRKSFINSR